MVLDIDEDKRRISLGMKQCKANPWDDFARNQKKGDKLSGQIKSITDFGVFIGLPGGIDGLVHLSDLSWQETGEEAVRKYKKGDEVEAVVLGIDATRNASRWASSSCRAIRSTTSSRPMTRARS